MESLNVAWSKPRMAVFISSIIFICAIGFVASDIYLPSLPIIASFFKKDAAYTQMTMSVFLLTMAVFQIFSGSLSDKFGRKKVLSICMFIFIVASYGCFSSSSINQLIFFRALQAIGACGGMSIGQAIIADLFNAKETGRVLSIVIPLVAFSPAVAPVLGGFLEENFNWQSIFLALMIYGFIVLIILISPIIPNIKKKSNLINQKSSFDIKTLFKIFTDKNFFSFALFIMSSNATYFAFLGISPFLLKKFGYSPVVVGYVFCFASFPFMFASFYGRKLSLKKSNLQIIFLGLLLSAIGSLLLGVFYFIEVEHILSLMVPVFIITIGNGLLIPFSSASAITLYPNNSGMVTGFLGSAQLTAASIGTALMGVLENGTLLPLALFDITITIFTLAYFLFVFGNPRYFLHDKV